jgi:hypothetical protein
MAPLLVTYTLIVFGIELTWSMFVGFFWPRESD